VEVEVEVEVEAEAVKCGGEMNGRFLLLPRELLFLQKTRQDLLFHLWGVSFLLPTGFRYYPQYYIHLAARRASGGGGASASRCNWR
jgi:hypothetical protein